MRAYEHQLCGWHTVLAGALLTLLSAGIQAETPSLSQVCKPFTDTAGGSGALESRSTVFGDGLLWRIEGGAAETPSHIFGTMHSQDKQVRNPSAELRLTMAQSDRLLIEVEPDPGANRAYMDAIYSADGPGLDERLPSVLYERLVEIGRDYGLPEARIDELELWAAFSQLGRPKPVNSPTQDMVIYQTMERMGKPVTGLETMPELLDSLASLRDDDQITILKDTLCNHSKIVRQSKTLRDLYLEGDLAGMVAFNRQPHYDEAVFERLMEAVLYRRNERMLERMLPYLEQGGAFVAVGALHLPEERGLLALLEEAGYEVTLARKTP